MFNCALILVFIRLVSCREYLFDVLENSTKGTFVGEIENYGGNSLKFVKLSDDMDSRYFSVDSQNGKIYTTTVINRESLLRCRGKNDCFVNFTVISSTKNEIEVHKIDINIIDINNNPPTFYPDQISVKINENYPPITEIDLPSPYDYDSPQNGIQKCFIHGNPMWATLRTKSKNTEWTVKLILDQNLMNFPRESLQIECVDRGNLSGKLRVEITKKLNKKCIKQIFDYKTLKISVPITENTDWIHITDLRAFPVKDSANFQNGSPNIFGLAGNSTDFKIDSKTGSIFGRKESLLKSENPIELKASVCCEDLCDFCQIFVEPNVADNFHKKRIQIFVSSVREDGDFAVEKFPQNSVAYIVVDTPNFDKVVCSTDRKDIFNLKSVSFQTFLLISGEEINFVNKNVECVEISCSAKHLASNKKIICVKILPVNSFSTVNKTDYFIANKNVDFLTNKLTFVLTTSILSLMFIIFSIFLTVRCYKLHKEEKNDNKNNLNVRPTEGILRTTQSPSQNKLTPVHYIERVSTESGCYLVNELRGINFNESCV